MKPLQLLASGLIAVLACLFSFLVFGADEASPVAKPDVKVGERWLYRRTNNLTNSVSFSTEGRVVSAGPDEILMVGKRSDQPVEIDVFFTSEWNAIAVGGLTFVPRTGYFQFPLKVGASYATSYETASKGSPARSKFDLTVRVIGWEDIAVPAGKFRALKVEGNGTFIRLDTGQRFGGTVRIRYWYVPEIKRWAKFTYEDGTRGLNYPDTTYADELLEFTVQ